MATLTPGAPNVVYVNNLTKTATDAEIQTFLASKGLKATEISAAKSRRFFYAAFATAAEAQAAVPKLTGVEFSGRTLSAEMSKPPKSEEERTAQKEARDEARAARRAAAPAPAAVAGGAGAAAPAEKRFFDKRVVVRSGSETTTLQAEALEKIFSTCGPLNRVRVGPSEKLARMSFGTAEAARNAVTLSGSNLAGNVFKVEFEVMRKRKNRSSAAKKAAGGAAAGGAAAAAAPKAAKPAKAPAAPREPRPVVPKHRVRVDELKAGTTPEQLQAAFSAAGEVTAAKVVRAGTHGFVTFADAAGLTKGLTVAAVEGAPVKVSVDEAAKRERRPREPIDVTSTLWVTGAAELTEEKLKGLFAAHAVQSVKVIARGKAAYVKLAAEANVAPAVAAVNGQGGLVVEKATGPQKRTRRARGAAAGAGAEGSA